MLLTCCGGRLFFRQYSVRLLGAITQDAEDRTALSAFRQIGSLGALLITSVIVIPILVHFDNVHIGYPAVMGMIP